MVEVESLVIIDVWTSCFSFVFPQLYLTSDLKSFQKVDHILTLIIYWRPFRWIHIAEQPPTVMTCLTKWKCRNLACLLTIKCRMQTVVFVSFTRFCQTHIIVTSFKCAKKSRLQEVNLEDDGSFLSWWKIVHFDPQERLEYEGQPVPVSLNCSFMFNCSICCNIRS